MIVFFCNKHYGGYGDRLIGMASAITIARILGVPFTYQWEPEFMALCTAPSVAATTTLNLINQKSSPVLEKEHLRDLWANQVVRLSANIPIDRLLWKNPHFSLGPYQAEAIRSLKDVMPCLGFGTMFKYEFGVQIRCGDTYCMPHAAAIQYIPEEEWPRFAAQIKDYLVKRGVRGPVYLTSDTHKIYPAFLALNDVIQFTPIERKDDIHFDYVNSNNRYKEIVADHLELQSCRRIITGLRSNFGTTAAYCSPICEEMILYPEFTSYDPRTQLVLKEFPYEAEGVGSVGQ